MLQVVRYPNDLLRRKGKYVDDFTTVQEEIEQMLVTLQKQENCAALAATQLSIVNPHRIVVFNLPDYEQKKEVWGLINPTILQREGTQKGEEGCMSVPGVSAEVVRAQKIQVKGFNLKGQAVCFTATDFLARCIQHEVDHLNGILYLDYLSPSKLRRIERQLYQQARN